MLSFPADCNTPALRTEYAYRVQELLRLRHNEVGKKFKEGKLSKDAWRSFLTSDFNPKSNEISDAILEARALLKQSKRWTIDVEAL